MTSATTIRRAARPGALLLAGLLLAACSDDPTPMRQTFKVRQADPAKAEIVVMVVSEKCDTNHFKVKETDSTVFVHAYYTRKPGAECPDTGAEHQRTIKLKKPLGNRSIVDGIPPDETRAPTEPVPSWSGVDI